MSFFSKKLSVGEVTDIVERAYNQAWWDSSHSKDRRTSVSNKSEGLARFLEREADNLRK